MSQNIITEPTDTEESDTLPNKRVIHPTIEITNGFKHYGLWPYRRRVLKDFNMSVYEGEIYTVVGPRGCGKTTLINVILGLLKLNSGTVKVFGFTPGHKLSGIPGIRVGYLPKYNGLFEYFTIDETFQYYGTLYGLHKSYVKNRTIFLSNLLNIPKTDRYIRNYSEEVKTQLSFAVTLLHDPDLLLLDDPYSGLDPLLKRSIWEYLKELRNEDKTILLTTQHCDEARWSDKISFMRNGQIILEGNIRKLLITYDEKSLEQLYCRAYGLELNQTFQVGTSAKDSSLIHHKSVYSEGFLYLGDNDTDEKGKIPAMQRVSKHEHKFESLKEIRDYLLRYKRFHILLHRDFLLSVRRYFLLVLFLFLPTCYLAVFCVTVGPTPSGLRLGIVNLEVPDGNCSDSSYSSCKLLSLISNNTIIQIPFISYKAADAAAKNLEVWGILKIVDNCTYYVTNYFVHQMNKLMLNPIFTLRLDRTSKIIASTIEETVHYAVKILISDASDSQRKLYRNMEKHLLEVEGPIFGMETSTNVEYMAPGLVLAFSFHSLAYVMAIAFVSYRLQCVTVRNHLAGVKLEESVLAHIICFGSFSVIQTMIMFFVLLSVFELPNRGPLIILAVIVLVQIVFGISFGITVGMFSNSTVTAGGWIFCSLIGTMMLCGVQWPVESYPPWLSTISQYLPLTKSVAAVRTVLQRGTSITHSQVWLGILVPVVWTLIFTFCYGCRYRII